MEARLVDHPAGHGRERFVRCRSHARAAKERAMLEPQRDRLSEELLKVDRCLHLPSPGRGLARLSGASGAGRGALRRRPARRRPTSFSTPKDGPVRCGHPPPRASGALPSLPRGGLPAAHPLHRDRFGQAVTLVHPAHSGRGRLPHGQARHRPAVGRPLDDRPQGSPPPHLLSPSRPVTLPRVMEECQGPRHPCGPPRRLRCHPPLPGHHRTRPARRAHPRPALAAQIA